MQRTDAVHDRLEEEGGEEEEEEEEGEEEEVKSELRYKNTNM